MHAYDRTYVQTYTHTHIYISIYIYIYNMRPQSRGSLCTDHTTCGVAAVSQPYLPSPTAADFDTLPSVPLCHCTSVSLLGYSLGLRVGWCGVGNSWSLEDFGGRFRGTPNLTPRNSKPDHKPSPSPTSQTCQRLNNAMRVQHVCSQS